MNLFFNERNCTDILKVMLFLKKYSLWILLVITLGLNSCEFEELQTDRIEVDPINPEYAVPLVKSDLSVDEMLGTSGSSFIRRDVNGFLSLVYRGSIFSATAEQSVVIPNQDFNQTFTLTAPQAAALNSGQAQTLSVKALHQFLAGSVEMDSLWLKAGTWATSISSQVKTGGTLNITIEDAFKAGTPLTLSIPFTYGGSTPVTASKAWPLVNYHMNLSKGPAGYNQVYITYELKLDATTNGASAGEQIMISPSLSGMKFSRFYGYIGKINLLDDGDTIDLKIFDKNTSGQFTLEDPRVKIICVNSFGVPVNAGFTKLEAFQDGKSPTSITGLPASLPIKVPSMSQIGQSLSDSVTLDKNSSNIASVINSKPNHVSFHGKVDLNPNGKQQRNFVTDKSQLQFIVDVEMPLWGSAKDFVMEDVQNAEMDLPEDDLLESVLFRFTAINGYPVEMTSQIYLVDSFNQVFDSIFSSKDYRVLEAAPVGADGKVTQPVSKTTDIVFDKLRADRLRRLKSLKMRAEVATSNSGGIYPSVKIYGNYVLTMKIGVKAKISVKIKQ